MNTIIVNKTIFKPFQVEYLFLLTRDYAPLESCVPSGYRIERSS